MARFLAPPSPFGKERREVLSLTPTKPSEGGTKKSVQNIRGASKKVTLIFHSQLIICMPSSVLPLKLAKQRIESSSGSWGEIPRGWNHTRAEIHACCFLPCRRPAGPVEPL